LVVWHRATQCDIKINVCVNILLNFAFCNFQGSVIILKFKFASSELHSCRLLVGFDYLN
jgi:hypothetical protein